MATTKTTTKEVLGVYGPGSNHFVGDGFPVRNLFPSNGVKQVSPFLLLDYAGPAYFPPANQPRGVGEHPHRGFETVTIAYQGAVDHRDSGGNSGTIRPGDVQWMTAASGVVHEEKHEREFAQRGGAFEMVQLWVNLPKAYKMTAPRYQSIVSDQIPTVDLGPGAFARVIAGELNGIAGPAKTFTPVNLFDLRMNPGSTAELNLPEGHNTAIVLLGGDVTVNAKQLEGEAQLAVLSPTGTAVSLTAKEHSLLLVLGGEPINEPVASHGPFVMNTQAELRQAIEDYKAGKMGHLQ
ncbi:MAG TPA: pirin family protein [Bryobacteraceae bacterium]|nr:pirin family protein [Bryobacteraceae bacterium]